MHTSSLTCTQPTPNRPLRCCLGSQSRYTTMPALCSACGAALISTGDRAKPSLTSGPQLLAGLLKLSATNEPPGDAQLSIIRPIVEETSARLSTLDAEVCRLQDRLQQLQEERALLLAYHPRVSAVLSPLRRMTHEILSEIFSWTPPSNRDVLSTANCPWVLTHVCRSWRGVAMTTPFLWSRIYVDFAVSQWYPLEMVRAQLERARALRVHFFASQDDDSAAQNILFALLAEHSARWTHLSIQLTSHLLPQIVDLDLRSLRRAWMQWDTDESQPSDSDSVDFFRTATSLVDIGVYCDFRFLPTYLPAPHQLTRYEFDGPWETYCELLKSLPNLQEVRLLRYFDDDEDWPVSEELIDLPRLRRLYVNDPQCLDYLRAPALEEIAIWLVADSSSLLERFLARSACFPRRLCIQGLLDAQSMAGILQKYGSFTEIAVTDEREEDEDTRRDILSSFLTVFTITPSAVALPQITKISFICRDAIDDTLYPLFLDMLDSRWNGGKCILESAELAFLYSSPDLDTRSAARMNELQKAGLQISVFSGDLADDVVDRWLLQTASGGTRLRRYWF
ncbi:hypothetical protein C8R45DRAFT_514828 [Mycena sanguinolenta]|nr:hypothetical protein C8R45DRAFT_514828 [Mycena sanguinolenta]